MDNELFELCKEVYKRTGWGDDDLYYYTEKTFEWRIVNEQATHDDIPLYTSDYLLEKLPHFIKLEQASGGYTPNGWYAEKIRSQDHDYKASVKADTPLKSLLKLTLALHEAGELTNGLE